MSIKLFQKKTLRYYYWLVIEFAKKHSRLIILSSLVTLLFMVSFVSLSPYITNLFLTTKQTIGIMGNYDYNNLPEEITTKISNGLISINNKGEITPTIATSWEVLNNGLTYRFHLRNNLIWSDGEKFSANQIKYNFKDVTTDVIDDKTIEFKLKKALPIFPTYLKDPLLKYPLVGVAGLYKVDKIKTKFGYIRELFLTSNLKDASSIVYKFYDNETHLIAAYKTGDIQQFSTSKNTIADIFAKWKNTVVVKDVNYNRLMTLFYNIDQPELKDKEIRQAVSAVIDQSVFKNLGEAATGPIPPISWAYDQNLKRQDYDPELAQKVIKKNLPATSSAALNFTTYYDYLDVASTIADALNKAGLKTNLSTISYDKATNFDMLLALWKVPLDPDQYYFWHSTQTEGNISNYKNVKIDLLLEQGRNTLSLSDRKKIYADYQKTIQDDPPAYFLFYPYNYTVKRK